MIKTININNKYLYLLLLVLLVRLPFFSEVLIDGDETTYLIIGKWFMEGNTPYERYTDFKTFYVYYIYGFLYQASNESLFIFRMYGAIIIFLTSIPVYRISLLFLNTKNSFFVACLFIISSSYLHVTSQSIQTQHLAMLPFIYSMYLLSIKKNYLLAAFLIALAVSIRSNLVLSSVFMLAFVFYTEEKKNFYNFFLGGFIFIIFTVFIAYFFNFFDLFISNAILDPINYTAKGNPTITNLINLIKNGILPFDKIFLLRLVFYSIGFLGFLRLLFTYHNNNKSSSILILGTFIFISISIIISGHAPSAYLIQISFFISFFFIYFLVSHYKLSLHYPIILILLISIIQLYEPYKNFFIYNIQKQKLYRGETVEIFNYINSQDKLTKDDFIYVYKHIPLHLMYNSLPISRYVHPPNIYKKKYLLKNNNTSTINEANNIFLKNSPKYIIVENTLNNFLKMAYASNQNKIDQITKKYLFKKKINKSYIYRLNNTSY